MIKFFNSKRGFTLTEIIGAALIIVISAGGTFSAYLLARRFAEKFKHRTATYNYAARIADELRYRHRYTDLANNTTVRYKADGTGTMDVNGIVTDITDIIYGIKDWPLTKEVVCSDPYVEYTVKDVWFGNDGKEYNTYSNDPNIMPQPANTRPAFKKIVVKLSWKERQ